MNSGADRDAYFAAGASNCSAECCHQQDLDSVSPTVKRHVTDTTSLPRRRNGVFLPSPTPRPMWLVTKGFSPDAVATSPQHSKAPDTPGASSFQGKCELLTNGYMARTAMIRIQMEMHGV